MVYKFSIRLLVSLPIRQGAESFLLTGHRMNKNYYLFLLCDKNAFFLLLSIRLVASLPTHH